MVSFTYEIHRKHTFISMCIYAVTFAAAFFVGFELLLASRGQLTPIFRLLPSTGSGGVAVFVSALFPLLVTYIAIRLNSSIVIWLLVFVKTCIFSFLCFGMREAYPGSGWLFQFLVLFSNQLSMIVYHCLWLRCLVFKNLAVRTVMVTCGIALCLICFFDLFVVCPFTASLFIHK